MHKYYMVLILFTSFLILSCSGDDDAPSTASNCEQTVVIDKTRYDNLASDEFGIISVELDEECMSITIGESGCDGLRWTADLIDSSEIAESFPEQRFLKIEFSNQEECDAVIQRTFTFDIDSLKIGESGTVILNLDGFDQQIRYEY